MKRERKKPPLWRRKAVRARAKAVRRRWKYTRRAVRRAYNRRYRFTYRRTITRVPARDELPALLNARGLLGRGAEIGVKLGVYSDALLRRWRGEDDSEHGDQVVSEARPPTGPRPRNRRVGR